ncbi:hypothetical protein GF359_07120 [candidate division WOR-3 bacterium]|uniref:DNA gyrase subunit A n=1 Tax=candidate division WOR-3 bacterium TaxID=2052148 RepID=A0A9D5KA96_UNCW3|nr:hypothetical protein [candidate division WOR-3 bacterium]MBD3364970.1 hypothetical protein [candidate division WOR-3 bacterium]
MNKEPTKGKSGDYQIIILTRYGYIKRMPESLFTTQGRGGVGRKAITLGDLDIVENAAAAPITGHLILFSNVGKAYHLMVDDLPEGSLVGKGESIYKLIDLARNERITHLLPLSDLKKKIYIGLATEKGICKRSPIIFYKKIRDSGVVVIGLKEDDELKDVITIEDESDIALFSLSGHAIRFDISQTRPTGRNATGVRGLGLHRRDRLAAMATAMPDHTFFFLTSKGFGKRLDPSELRCFTKRGSRGILIISTSDRVGDVVSVRSVRGKDNAVIFTRHGMSIRLNTKRISLQKRTSFGVRLISLSDADEVVAAAIIPADFT